MANVRDNKGNKWPEFFDWPNGGRVRQMDGDQLADAGERVIASRRNESASQRRTRERRERNDLLAAQRGMENGRQVGEARLKRVGDILDRNKAVEAAEQRAEDRKNPAAQQQPVVQPEQPVVPQNFVEPIPDMQQPGDGQQWVDPLAGVNERITQVFDQGIAESNRIAEGTGRY